MRTSIADLPGSVISGQKKIVFNAGYHAYTEYGEGQNIFSHKIQLVFSPFGLPFVPIEILGDDVGKIIQELTWTKDRNNPGGILQCTIVPDAEIIKNIVKVLDKYSGNVYSKIWGSLGVDLEDLFKPMTLCQLWIDGYHVMIGYVRGCQRSASVENESKSVSYALTIEELGNLYNLETLKQPTVIKNPLALDLTDSPLKALGITSLLRGVPVAQAMQAILHAFTATTLLKGSTLSDGFPLAYRLLATQNPLGGISNNSIVDYITYDDSMFELNNGQTLWSFIQSFLPSPWMEFFTESGGRTIVTNGIGSPSVLFPGFSYVVSRTVPYSNPMLGFINPYWIAGGSGGGGVSNVIGYEINAFQMIAGGDFVIVTDDMIMEKDLGVDSINQNTMFSCEYSNKGTVTGSNGNLKPVRCVGPLNPLASGGVQTFGQREMSTQIDCTSLEGMGTTASVYSRLVTLMGLRGVKLSTGELQNLLAVWFRNQSRFREGSITCRGIPYARAGMYCLYLPSMSGKKVENVRDIGIYYIDSLTHSYQLNNESMSFTTTLNVIRGTPLPDNIGKTLLLLFDWEVLPPEIGLTDGQFAAANSVRQALNKVRGGINIPFPTIPGL